MSATAFMGSNVNIYHITHVDNLPNIARETRLWCDAQRIAQNLPNTNIGYSHIKERRLRHPVGVAARETLGNYVPFNFCPRSVMLYVVYRGHENYSEGQRQIVHLVSSVEAICATGRPWFFTDRHADLDYAQQIDTLDRLNEVDLSVMQLQNWNNPEVKEKRQAEFLVYDWCPWTAIQAIGVIDQAMEQLTHDTLRASEHKPPIAVRPSWYY